MNRDIIINTLDNDMFDWQDNNPNIYLHKKSDRYDSDIIHFYEYHYDYFHIGEIRNE